ncbi:hypothetical protein ACA910_008001 [Epithemia clementina (nom. ined.)]
MALWNPEWNRRLNEELADDVNNNNNNDYDDSVENIDISLNDSWRGIYVSLVITVWQVVLMLTLFEACRRSSTFGHVYDRRRLQRPTRTPPPLMQQRLWCCEWWNLRLTDPHYQQMSKQEAWQRQVLQQEQEQREQQQQQQQQQQQEQLLGAQQPQPKQQPKQQPQTTTTTTSAGRKQAPDDNHENDDEECHDPQTHTDSVAGPVENVAPSVVHVPSPPPPPLPSPLLTLEENWHILQQAERICFRESPFFDPTQDDEEEEDEEDDDLEDWDNDNEEKDLGPTTVSMFGPAGDDCELGSNPEDEPPLTTTTTTKPPTATTKTTATTTASTATTAATTTAPTTTTDLLGGRHSPSRHFKLPLLIPFLSEQAHEVILPPPEVVVGNGGGGGGGGGPLLLSRQSSQRSRSRQWSMADDFGSLANHTVAGGGDTTVTAASNHATHPTAGATATTDPTCPTTTTTTKRSPFALPPLIPLSENANEPILPPPPVGGGVGTGGGPLASRQASQRPRRWSMAEEFGRLPEDAAIVGAVGRGSNHEIENNNGNEDKNNNHLISSSRALTQEPQPEPQPEPPPLERRASLPWIAQFFANNTLTASAVNFADGHNYHHGEEEVEGEHDLSHILPERGEGNQRQQHGSNVSTPPSHRRSWNLGRRARSRSPSHRRSGSRASRPSPTRTRSQSPAAEATQPPPSHRRNSSLASSSSTHPPSTPPGATVSSPIMTTQTPTRRRTWSVVRPPAATTPHRSTLSLSPRPTTTPTTTISNSILRKPALLQRRARSAGSKSTTQTAAHSSPLLLEQQSSLSSSSSPPPPSFLAPPKPREEPPVPVSASERKKRKLHATPTPTPASPTEEEEMVQRHTAVAVAAAAAARTKQMQELLASPEWTQSSSQFDSVVHTPTQQQQQQQQQSILVSGRQHAVAVAAAAAARAKALLTPSHSMSSTTGSSHAKRKDPKARQLLRQGEKQDDACEDQINQSVLSTTKSGQDNDKTPKITNQPQSTSTILDETNVVATGGGTEPDHEKSVATSGTASAASSPTSPLPKRRRVRFRQLQGTPSSAAVSETTPSLATTRRRGTFDFSAAKGGTILFGGTRCIATETLTDPVPVPAGQGSGRGKGLRAASNRNNLNTKDDDDAWSARESARLARLRSQPGDDDDAGSHWNMDFLSFVGTFVRRRVLMLQESNNDDNDQENGSDDNGGEDDDDDGEDNGNGGNADLEGEQDNEAKRRRRQKSTRAQQEFLAEKVYRRPLSLEQQELLRCIGLDAFMTLRFLEFGFDVSFWPFIVSLFTLIPTFATGDNDQVGFYRTTTLNLSKDSLRYWVVAVFAMFHFLYILRRIWIEWEIFIPLRYDFLQNGDFDKTKYQYQYRNTCLVEYVPRTHKRDKDVYKFFDAIFPGQVKRAEVLLNTEHLRSLIIKRKKHLSEYENIYARKVHNLAEYMRQQELIRRTGNPVKKWCHKATMPRRPMEPLIVVVQDTPREETGGRRITRPVRDRRIYEALPWHHYMIRKLNKQIDDEYIRLAQARRRVVSNKNANWLKQRLGIGVLHGSGEEHVHSSTAFVEFRSLVAKQQAIQCNLTGTNRFFELKQVPEIRDIRWENAHVAQSLIDARKMWANVAMVGGLVAWSFLVLAIRSIDNVSELFGTDYPIAETLLDSYLPAIIVEGLVRIIPFIIKAICVWIRFKATSEVDLYVVRWYFGFRLLTFVFVIVGGTVVDSGDQFVDDPMGFLEELSNNVADNSVFFISYIIVAGGLQIAVRLSQFHNVMMDWLIHKKNGREEAISQRELDRISTSVKTFHLEEFIPLFLFIFMISALYGSLAPLACFFSAIFFKCAYKVFKYMTLYVYGNKYEGGGFLFYTLTKVLFVVLYFLVLVIGSYLSLRGSGTMAGVFTLLLLLVIGLVQVDVNRTFVAPSTTLSLARACVSDYVTSGLTVREKNLSIYLAAKEELERLATSDEESGDDDDLMQMLLPPRPGMDASVSEKTNDGSGVVSSGEEAASNEEARKLKAVREMERRYQADDGDTSVSDVTDSDAANNNKSDFFIYRQPSLNRATWEVAPRPYRDNLSRLLSSDEVLTDEVEMWR